MKLGLFPKGVRIAGAKAIGWDSVAVKAWVAAQFDTEHDA
jgi:predicted DNA-binding transcriptional regulator AlpA